MHRKNRKAASLRPTRIALAVGAALLSGQTAWADPAANQLPTGGTVAAGTATITTTGSKMQIDQSSDKAIINWQNFSIGSSGWVNFNQPSASSVALNRSTQPAEIFGRLSANGQVFVTSQAGVYFARTAQVDVGGLVATNLSIRDQDFLAGRYIFFNDGSSGSVINDGTIIAPGGYAALAGTQVRNNGVIVAQAGTVTLAAGDRITLDMIGDGLIKVSVDAAALNALALNAGTIQADGGRVVLTARSANALLDTVVNNTGIIRARSLVEKNGEIVLDGSSAGVVANSGAIDVAGTEAGTTGGTVSVQGQNVYLASGSSIDASGNAGGGTVTVKGTDTAYIYGDIDARGTGEGASGGFVETSGHYLEVARAPNVGAGGTWLIDPYDIEVVAGGGATSNDGSPTFTPNGDSSQIGADLITGQLNAGSNVVLDTGGAGSPGAQAGDIRVQAAIDKTVANPASLSLKAFHDVQINEAISIASAFGPTGFGTLTIDAGNNVVVSAPITTQGGGLSIRAGGFTNQSAINNGVGGDLKPGMAIFADRFDLVGGTINGGQGSVGLFTRTATNSLGVESAGDTRITNADIASITTSPDSPSTNANQLLIGVGSQGTMTIGADAQVNGGSKNLVFSAFGGPGTRVTVGANGVTTTGDVVVNATGGAIGGTGTIGGNRVQLIASTGIGASTARVGTAAGTLAARTSGGSVFINETDDVRLGAVTIAGQTVTNGVAPGNAYDLTAGGNVSIDGTVSVGGRLNLGAGGTLNLNAAGVQDSQLFSSGGQTISAAALSMNAQDGRRAVISNTGGNQVLTIGAGGMNLNVVAGAGVAQISNNSGVGTQTVQTSGAINVVGGSALPSTNSGIFQNQTGKQTVTAGAISLQGALAGNTGGAFVSNTAGGGDQEVNVAGGAISISGGAVGTANRAGIVSNGNQTISGNPDITLIGGSSGTGTGAASNSVFIQTTGAGKQQIINAGTITLTAGTGGTDTSATITANKQTITTSGDVLIFGGGGGGDANGARIGGIGGATPGATDVKLTVGRDLRINAGSANGASVGSTVAAATPHTIDISAGRDVVLNASDAAPVRIGTSFNFAPATGDITINAGRDIQLTASSSQSAAIRTAGNVNLTAGGSISENQFNAAISAAKLSTSSFGNTTLTGDNRLGSFTGSTTAGALSLHNVQSLSISGPVNSGGSVDLDVDGVLAVDATAQDAIVTSIGGQTITADALVMNAQAGHRAILQNFGSGDQTVSATAGGIEMNVVGGAGVAQIINNTAPGGNQTVSATETLHIVGGVAAPSSNSGIFLNSAGGGVQSVSAGAIVMEGANNGLANSGALISTGQNDQAVNATGDITLLAGSVGNTGIFGAAGRNQDISAHHITLTNSADTATSNNSGAFILGGHQHINASGDMTLTSRASGGTLAGVRIGSISGGTDLNLFVGGNLVLTGGTAPNNGVGLGSSAAGTAQPNDITIFAGGDIVLNGGDAAGSGARIGSGSNGVATGTLFIQGRSIELNGGVAPAFIRTAGDVTLSASGPSGMSENSNGSIQAGSLSLTSMGPIAFTGPNQVGTLNVLTYGGDLSFNNTGTLNLAQVATTSNLLGAGDAAITNNGDVNVTNFVTTSGTLTLNVEGKLSVIANAGQVAQLSAQSGQTITARSIEVTAQSGGLATITNNSSGNQVINVTGGAAETGFTVQAAGAGGAAFVTNFAPTEQRILVTNADFIKVDGRGGNANISNPLGEQTVSITGNRLNAIRIGSDGALGGSIVNGSAQTITAGNPGESGSITLTGSSASGRGASFVNSGPTAASGQTIRTSGDITIRAGAAPVQTASAGIFQNRPGLQSMSAANISLQAGSSGSGNGAFINAGFGGDQEFDVAGTISITGGSGGVGNRAGFAGSANQTITGNPNIVVIGGSGGGAAGNGNNAFITTTGGSGKQQTINAGSLNLFSGSGGIDNSASIAAAKQVINVAGDVNLVGSASAGTLGGVRLGGLGGATLTSTDLTLTLNNGGNLTLTGGSLPTNIAAIGSGVGPSPLTNTITINASGNVVLNPGSSSARIGNSTSAPDSGGDISINAASIELNGTGATPTFIRTGGNVTLNATTPAGMSEGSNGFIQAGSLSATSMGPISLTGPNRVGTLNVLTYGGDLTFNNTGTLNLSNVVTTSNLLGAGNAIITNNGDANVTGFVTTSGALTMNVAGALKLEADATHDATVSSNAGQTINAQSLTVTARNGHGASLTNSGSGNQAISISGGGLGAGIDVQNLGGPIALIASNVPGATQTITLSGGDHLAVKGLGGFAGINSNGGAQTISLTGAGANAVVVGAAEAQGSSQIVGRGQTVTAGSGTESGSITMVGSAANGTNANMGTQLGSGAVAQTISTTGNLTVTGGSAIGAANTGLFHSGTGLQSVTAANIVLQGGTSTGTSGGGAFINNTGGGGDQDILATGSITLSGGAVGQGNRAFIITNGNQTVHGDPTIVITGGAGGGGSAVLNSSNGAGVVANAAGKLQTVNAASISLTGGGGNDSFAVLTGANQVIVASGDVRLTGGSGTGASIARIGGSGQPAGATNLTLSARDVVLIGGSAAGADAGIGSTPLGSNPLPGTISVNALRDVILNSGTGAGARIGTSQNFATPTADAISVVAGRDIQLNGTTNAAAIRTAGNVVLTAGGTISEMGNGFVAGSTLDTTSGGAQSLVGPNQVSHFTAAATSGDVSLRNTASVLTLGTMDLSGSLSLDQTGALAVPGTVTALNQSMQATGDVTIGTANGGAAAGLFAPGTITISTPQSIVLRGSDVASGASSVVSAGGLVTLSAGDLYVTGGAASQAAASVLSGELAVTTARNIALTSGSGLNANALLYSANNITMTVGGLLTLNGGHSVDNWVRVQTQRYDGTITLNFPNAASGSVSVDGFVDRFKHGEDGFFTADKPAKLGDTLFVNYGL